MDSVVVGVGLSRARLPVRLSEPVLRHHRDHDQTGAFCRQWPGTPAYGDPGHSGYVYHWII